MGRRSADSTSLCQLIRNPNNTNHHEDMTRDIGI